MTWSTHMGLRCCYGKNTVKKLIPDGGQPWGFFSKTWHFWLVWSSGIIYFGFWNYGKNCIASAYMSAAAKWASFIALIIRVVCIVHKHASWWPTNLIDVQWANISYLIIILSIFSHGSEKKLAGVLRGLTNQPHVRKSTRDTPLWNGTVFYHHI